MRSLFAAIGFLTRVPMPARVDGDPRTTAASLAWYPLVGLLIGALLCAFAWLLRDTAAVLSAALLVVLWIGLTGALHLDGLADSADAWIGGMGDREKTLAIMKDPRCGPAGVVSLIAVLLLKFAALASADALPWRALLLAPMLARGGLTLLFLTTPYVRSQGIGTGLTDAPRSACMLALGLAAGLCLCCGWRGALALGAAVLVFALWRRACMIRLGGFTGDTGGALAEMVEMAVLVALAVH